MYRFLNFSDLFSFVFLNSKVLRESIFAHSIGVSKKKINLLFVILASHIGRFSSEEKQDFLSFLVPRGLRIIRSNHRQNCNTGNEFSTSWFPFLKILATIGLLISVADSYFRLLFRELCFTEVYDGFARSALAFTTVSKLARWV